MSMRRHLSDFGCVGSLHVTLKPDYYFKTVVDGHNGRPVHLTPVVITDASTPGQESSISLFNYTNDLVLPPSSNATCDTSTFAHNLNNRLLTAPRAKIAEILGSGSGEGSTITRPSSIMRQLDPQQWSNAAHDIAWSRAFAYGGSGVQMMRHETSLPGPGGSKHPEDEVFAYFGRGIDCFSLRIQPGLVLSHHSAEDRDPRQSTWRYTIVYHDRVTKHTRIVPERLVARLRSIVDRLANERCTFTASSSKELYSQLESKTSNLNQSVKEWLETRDQAKVLCDIAAYCRPAGPVTRRA
ncbi:uncharacterized protein MKK02DRAFT_42749 [Dioszegia hungarica]|uniref:Uncharacterized protein n=1 Tax=Dioszegia hungarica TaxID=4972 RepID=A0AA38HE66_9TREE|nr:uncharacterized protein MKK02DRAFT_42749 [Dioszegia hungarica]KAI9638362.1 hypothetical protein MKK02DRAFT_42749 [Dioszegia hungarica]